MDSDRSREIMKCGRCWLSLSDCDNNDLCLDRTISWSPNTQWIYSKGLPTFIKESRKYSLVWLYQSYTGHQSEACRETISLPPLITGLINGEWQISKFSRVCSISLELTIPTTVCDVSILMNSFSGRLETELFRRAYGYGTDLAPMWQLTVSC